MRILPFFFVLFITTSVNAISPTINGFFLGEYIYSNHHLKAGSHRFVQPQDFDIFCFPRAVLNLQADHNAAKVNAYMGFNFRESCGYGSQNDPRSFVKYGVTDHAYVKFKNEYGSALFGVQYVPYGDFNQNKIPASFTQLLTQTQAAALTFNYAFIANFKASVFLLSSPRMHKDSATRRNVNNFGAQLQYKTSNTLLKVGYLYNIANSVNYLVVAFNNASKLKNPLNNSYTRAVGGIALNIKQFFQHAFNLELAFTSALRAFDVSEVNWQDKGAIPKALLIRLNKKIHTQTVSVNYQHSWQAQHLRGKNLNFGLPKNRFQIDYVIEIYKNVEFGVHYIVDRSYNSLDKLNQTFISTLSYAFDLL